MAHKLRMFLYFYICKWKKKGKGGKEDEVEAEAAKSTTREMASRSQGCLFHDTDKKGVRREAGGKQLQVPINC